MWTRKLLLGALVASTFAAVAPLAQARVDVFVNTAPPELRQERVPAPRAGYLWAPGYWNWQSNRHVWAKGHWEKERAGFSYRPNAWTQQDGRWTNQRGGWDRNAPNGDRDRDGVPNRADRAPDNPLRQ
jgi:hypothetical protein